VIRVAIRIKEGRKTRASAMIIDIQSARSAEGGEKRGYDGGKKVSGRKRNLVVATMGLVVVAKVTAGNVQNVHAGQQVLADLAQ
jgi:putative transposase